MKMRSGVGLVLSLLGVCACVAPSASSSGEQRANEADPARLAAVREAFVATDWTTLADEAFTESNRSVQRHGIVITPPGERFAAWMVGGTIQEPALDELLATVASRLTSLVEAEGVIIQRRYPAAEVPPPVIQAIWFDEEGHVERRKGYGFALRSGDVTAHVEVIAMPYRDGWRVDGYLREPVTDG